MTSVLLSIKPNFVKKILSGRKRYEFRRSIFKRKDVEVIFIYSSSPVKKLVGFFKIGLIIADSPQNLWDRCMDLSGLTEKEFFGYFRGKNLGYAIEIKEVVEFEEALDPRQLIPNFIPPQSYTYI